MYFSAKWWEIPLAPPGRQWGTFDLSQSGGEGKWVCTPPRVLAKSELCCVHYCTVGGEGKYICTHPNWEAVGGLLSQASALLCILLSSECLVSSNATSWDTLAFRSIGKVVWCKFGSLSWRFSCWWRWEFLVFSLCSCIFGDLGADSRGGTKTKWVKIGVSER